MRSVVGESYFPNPPDAEKPWEWSFRDPSAPLSHPATPWRRPLDVSGGTLALLPSPESQGPPTGTTLYGYFDLAVREPAEYLRYAFLRPPTGEITLCLLRSGSMGFSKPWDAEQWTEVTEIFRPIREPSINEERSATKFLARRPQLRQVADAVVDLVRTRTPRILSEERFKAIRPKGITLSVFQDPEQPRWKVLVIEVKVKGDGRLALALWDRLGEVIQRYRERLDAESQRLLIRDTALIVRWH